MTKSRIKYCLQGNNISDRDIDKFGLNPKSKDLKYNNGTWKLDFVGIVISKNDDILAVFPKHYTESVASLTRADIKLLLRVIQKSNRARGNQHGGEKLDIKTNFPYSPLLKIVAYYQKYGLYKPVTNQIFNNTKGKIAWKHMVQSSTPIISQRGLILLPFFSFNKNPHANQVTLIMSQILSQNRTLLGLLGYFIDFDDDRPISQEKSVYYTHYLSNYLNSVYLDVTIRLIKNMIELLKQYDASENNYYKCYSFNYVWEDIVADFVNRHFSSLSEKLPKLQSISLKNAKFNIQKAKKVDNAHTIKMDYYLRYQNIQVILDAKYYENKPELNYKQIVYYTFMDAWLKRQLKGDKKYEAQTYSALIFPTERKDYAKKHANIYKKFLYPIIEGPIIIDEYYLNIKNAMAMYNTNK